MATEKIDICSITYVTRANKPSVYVVKFKGGMYVEDTPAEALARVRDLVGWMVEANRLDRMKGKKR